MAKKLIAYDDQKPGLGLPDPVEERLDDRYLGAGGAPSAGFVGVISDTEPEDYEIDGQPVVWFKTVDTSGPNLIPEIDIPQVEAQGLTVTALITAFDPDGDTLTYVVDWGDGNTTEESSLDTHTHTYATAGTYTITATVTDPPGATASASTTIYVAAEITDRWGYDSFSYPDGTILAGWTTNLNQDAPVDLEEGELVWGPGDQTTGGNQLYQKAHVTNGVFTQGTPDGTVEGAQIAGATVLLPEDSYRVAFRYRITPEGVREALARVSLYLACSPVTARNTRDTTSLSIRLTDVETIQINAQSNAAFTTVANVEGIPRSGHLEASFDADTGEVTLHIDGSQVWSGIYSGPAHPKVGIDTRGPGTIDDFEVGPL